MWRKTTNAPEKNLSSPRRLVVHVRNPSPGRGRAAVYIISSVHRPPLSAHTHHSSSPKCRCRSLAISLCATCRWGYSLPHLVLQAQSRTYLYIYVPVRHNIPPGVSPSGTPSFPKSSDACG